MTREHLQNFVVAIVVAVFGAFLAGIFGFQIWHGTRIDGVFGRFDAVNARIDMLVTEDAKMQSDLREYNLRLASVEGRMATANKKLDVVIDGIDEIRLQLQAGLTLPESRLLVETTSGSAAWVTLGGLSELRGMRFTFMSGGEPVELRVQDWRDLEAALENGSKVYVNSCGNFPGCEPGQVLKVDSGFHVPSYSDELRKTIERMMREKKK